MLVVTIGRLRRTDNNINTQRIPSSLVHSFHPSNATSIPALFTSYVYGFLQSTEPVTPRPCLPLGMINFCLSPSRHTICDKWSSLITGQPKSISFERQAGSPIGETTNFYGKRKFLRIFVTQKLQPNIDSHDSNSTTTNETHLNYLPQLMALFFLI